MKAWKEYGIHKPFKNLKSLLKAKSISINTYPVEKVLYKKKLVNSEDDEALFQAAMADVTPLPPDKKAYFEANQKPPLKTNLTEENEPVKKQLKDLIKCGKGFVVEHTSGYIEWVGPKVCSKVCRMLHGGQFSIQGYIDLHGFTLTEAKEAFEDFLKDSVMTGKRGVLIVHGRGLSSPNEPVLKTNVYGWLTKGPWRKWIIAFASARSCDGGTGATYVLLRHRPLTKRQRKRNR